jgi:hypothetical protein
MSPLRQNHMIIHSGIVQRGPNVTGIISPTTSISNSNVFVIAPWYNRPPAARPPKLGLQA